MLYPRVIIENKKSGNIFFKLGLISNICGVLNQLIIRCNQNTYIVTTAEKDINDICKNLNVSNFTVRRCIKQLLDLRVLIKLGKGSYKINRDIIELDFKHGTWI